MILNSAILDRIKCVCWFVISGIRTLDSGDLQCRFYTSDTTQSKKFRLKLVAAVPLNFRSSTALPMDFSVIFKDLFKLDKTLLFDSKIQLLSVSSGSHFSRPSSLQIRGSNFTIS